MRRLARLRAWTLWTPVLLALACGGSADNNLSSFGFGGNGASSATGASASGAQGGINSTGNATTNNTSVGSVQEGRDNITEVTPIAPTDPSACNTAINAGKAELDIVIMMDKSMTMTETTSSGNEKWTDINDAVKQFVNDPNSAGIGVSIGFFAIFLTHSPCPASGCISCNIADYAQPAVPIASLNGNAQAISDAIDNVVLEGGNPNGETPTRVALAGAIQYATATAKQYPERKVVVALATDGLPNVCDSSLQSVLTVAQDGVNGSPSIKTYVLGILASNGAATADGRQSGEELPNLNQMADAGGTGAVFLIDTSKAAKDQFVRAMDSIRDANDVGCQFDIPQAPSGQVLDLRQASVSYDGQPLDWRKTSGDCTDTGGFYYDNNDHPTTIRLCTTTCDAVKADKAAQINIVLGCPVGTGGGSGGGASETGQGGQGGEPDATVQCRLDGQFCEDATECCTGTCNGANVCGATVN